MTIITWQDGGPVFKDGKVGSGAGCCCDAGKACCGPDCGAIFPVDFLPDAGMDASFSAFLSGRGYSNIEYFEEPGPQFASWTADCCKTDQSDTDSFEITGTIDGNPASLTVTVALCVSTKAEGTSCAEGLTAEECESLGGTVSDAATCDPDPCACPDVEGCNLVVVLDYPGAPQEYSNEPIGELGGDCLLSGEIEDIPIESGGDITWNLTVGTDGNGNPVPQNITIVRTVDSPDNDQSCDDGITDCVPVLFTIDCNPLP